MKHNDKKKEQDSGEVSWKEYYEKKKKNRENQGHSTQDNGTERKITLSIKGMSCTGCETRIERILSEFPGIKNIHVSYNTSVCSFIINKKAASPEKTIEALRGAGYEAVVFDADMKIITDKKNDSFSITQLIGIALIIAAVFFILSKTGIFNLVPNVDKSVGYGLLFMIGALTSVHCIAMCGGISITQTVKSGDDAKNIIGRLKPGFLYNIGRLVSYTVIGGIAGAIGSFVRFSESIQGVIIAAAGLLMIIMGINMIDIFPFLRKFMIRPPRFLSKGIGKIANGKGPLIVGLLNGLMPCGPLQTMQLYALSTGSFFSGALSMFLFGLGTIPLMFGFGALNLLLAKKYSNRMLKISAILVLLLGAGMIVRGLTLTGVDTNIASGNESTPDTIPVIAEDEQYIESTITPSSYEPIMVRKGIPVKWNIKVKEENLNGCNNRIIIPALNIRKQLVPGDNYISFTPGESGKIPFTCWMGMIRSTIQVVDDPKKADKKVFEELNPDLGSNGSSNRS